MKKTPPVRLSAPKQSDIIIHPDGEVSVSFLWDDFNGVQHPQLIPPVHAFTFDNVTESDYDNHYKSCRMCPKRCGFDRIKQAHPRCGGHEIRVGTWGLTLGDEPEISGTRGSGAIMLSKCPLTCPSCHNPEMVSGGNKTSLNDFISICNQLLEQGAHNIQILSPTVHMAKLKPILEYLKNNAFPIPIVFKSSGVESLNYLSALTGLVDIYLPDFKYGPDSAFAKRSGFPNYMHQATITIEEMIKQTGTPQLDSDGLLQRGVLVRHVKAPIPESERQHIYHFLNRVKDETLISVTDNFVNLE